MMNFPGVIGADEETLARIDVASSTASGLVDGHAPLVFGRDLDAYAASGIIADHECTKVDEALEKLSRGMYIMLREERAAMISRRLPLLSSKTRCARGVAASQLTTALPPT